MDHYQSRGMVEELVFPFLPFPSHPIPNRKINLPGDVCFGERFLQAVMTIQSLLYAPPLCSKCLYGHCAHPVQNFPSAQYDVFAGLAISPRGSKTARFQDHFDFFGFHGFVPVNSQTTAAAQKLEKSGWLRKFSAFWSILKFLLI
jgi:hypothetical protein